MNASGIDSYYFGPREKVQAEVSTPDYYAGKYLCQPIGERQFDAEGFNTKRELREHLRQLRFFHRQHGETVQFCAL